MILFFSLLFAMSVALFVAGFLLERAGAGERKVSDRLRQVGRAPIEIGPIREYIRDTRYSSIPWVDRILRSLNVGEQLELLLYQAGMTMRAGVLVVLSAAGGMAGYVAGVAWFHRVGPGLILLVLFGCAPYVFVRLRKARRMQAFRVAFPDALDLLVSGLRAGLSFPAAMQIVAEESPEPVRSEFAVTVEEQSLGLEMREAMVNMTRRVDVLDLRFFVTAVLLQRETGGNLAEVLQNSAALIRDRFRVLGDIQTFTTQGKMTALVLVALPVAVGGFTYMITPDYFKPMIESDAGRMALWVAAGMQALGCFVIYKIVNIKV